MGFLDNIFKDGKSKKSNNTNNNPLANVFGNKESSFQGAGQSLGGSKPGTVIPIVLKEPGSLGVRVEKRSTKEGTAIVHSVVPQSQADAAGLQRGDILCFAGSNGQSEIMYDMFLEMAKSTQRPIHLEIRRMSTSLDKKADSTISNQTKSADVEARRKAVIAAAEAREKAHKVRSKPVHRVTKTTLARQQQQQQQQQQNNQEPLSEISRQAAQAAKHGEAQVAAQLGYNPYEPSRATAGQARSATTAVQHGSLNTSNAAAAAAGGAGGGGGVSLPSVAPPRNPTTKAEESMPTSVEFQEAYTTLFSTNSDIKASVSIMKKLLVNATTKGQSPGDDAAKFRKVRLANAKIKAAIVDVTGGVEVMMACGFVLDEQDGESVLLYPADTPGPDWLPTALKRLEQ